MFLQDLVFPAVSASLFIGHASVIVRKPRWPQPLVLVLIAGQGIAFSHTFVAERIAAVTAARSRTQAYEAVWGKDHSRARLSEMNRWLDQVLPTNPYDYEMTRAEQEAGIRFINRMVGPDELAIASNSLNVFRRSPHDWAATLLVTAEESIELALNFTRMAPFVFRFFDCTSDIYLMDVRTSGMEENLVRELEHSRPRLILVDRFLFDLTQRYPAYARIIDENYTIQLDPNSRLFFALRNDGPWVESGLPPLPPVDCRGID